MKSLILPLLIAGHLVFAQAAKQAEPKTEATTSPCTMEVEVTDIIGPATVDLLKRVEKRSTKEKCTSILLLVNTPGGSLESTRILVEMILNSPVPYLCLISPSGGHAGSAGAIIL